MMIKHNFRSGNSCEIYIPNPFRLGAYNRVRVEWENYPPSDADLQEYEQEVYPAWVIPALFSGHLESVSRLRKGEFN